jgi:hypothetical protein
MILALVTIPTTPVSTGSASVSSDSAATSVNHRAALVLRRLSPEGAHQDVDVRQGPPISARRPGCGA